MALPQHFLPLVLVLPPSKLPEGLKMQNYLTGSYQELILLILHCQSVNHALNMNIFQLSTLKSIYHVSSKYSYLLILFLLYSKLPI